MRHFVYWQLLPHVMMVVELFHDALWHMTWI